MAVANRSTGWLTPEFHATFREILRENSGPYAVVVPAYCLMPDHLHVLSVGLSIDSNQRLWARAARRMINQALKPIHLQKQAYDHVLRPDETKPDTFAALAHYISANPVRAGLTSLASAWPYTGAMVPSLPTLDPRNEDFREQWWAYWNMLNS